MSSSSPASPEPPPENENAAADLPLTMAASVVLDQLPKDAHQALETAGDLEHAKGTIASPSTASSSTASLPQKLVDLATDEAFKVLIRLHPLPGAPTLRSLRFKLSSNQRFEMFVNLMRRKLKLEEHESVFCYVNSVFAPGLDEGIGNLWRCFKVGEELNVSYSVTPAFG